MALLVNEISSRLRRTYVNNVYSIGESQVIRFRQPGDAGEDVWLVASPRYGAWVSGKVSERAETTPFTSSLRGSLMRAAFDDLVQRGTDRIYDFSFKATNESNPHLLLELMPPGNIIVTDDGSRVLLALREVRTPRRRLVRGGTYLVPAQRRVDPASVDEKNVAEMLASEKTLGQAVGRNLALPRKYVREVLHRLSMSEGELAAGAVSRAGEIAATVKGLVEEARSRPAPCLCETPEGPELFAVKPTAFATLRRADTLSALCDEVLLPFLMGDLEMSSQEDERGGNRSRLAELRSTLEGLRRQETELSAEALRLRDLAKKAAGASPEELEALSGDSRTRDSARKAPSPAALSSQLYDRAKEAERKVQEVRSAARKIQGRLTREETQSRTQPRTSVALRREAREWYEKFRWFYTSEGRLAIGGRDAQSNSILVRRHLDKNDTVFHADLFGSPFFLLKGGAAQTDQEARELAQATVAFSSAWKTGLSAADAYWVTPDQVETSAPSGEYLPRGSFMIRGKKHTIQHLLVEVAVGTDREGRIVAGPEGAVSKMAGFYVVVAPYREKLSETAKKVLRELQAQKSGAGEPGQGEIATTIDDVIRALPAGGGKIVRRRAKGGEGAASAEFDRAGVG